MQVYIFSGRDRRTLDNWFPPSFNIGVTADQGCFLRFVHQPKDKDKEKDLNSCKSPTLQGFQPEKFDDGWELIYPDLDLTWRDTVKSLMQHYAIRTPGTFIEETEVQLVWNHRNAEEPFGSTQVLE